MYLVVFIIASLPFVLPIISLVRQSGFRRKLSDLEDVVAEQHRTIERLTARLSKLSAPTPEAAPTSKPAEKPLHMPAAAEAPQPRVVSPPVIEWPPALSPDAPATPGTSPSVVHVLNVPRDTAPAGSVTSPPADVTPPPHATPPPSRPPAPPLRPSQESPAVPPPQPPAPRPQRPMPPPPPPPAQGAFAGFDWEQLVGVRLFSAIAGIALVLAGVFFLRYSMDRGWLAPPVRVAIGIIVAIALLIVCERRAAQRYRVTANALDAAAVALLFATFFSAHVLWHLIPSAVAFGLLALVTVLAVLLSIRHDSIFIAVLGLVGGFATPALLSTGENRPIPLFAYLLLLDIGLAWVAQRKKWPVLAILSLVLTTIYQWVWVGTFLTASQLPLAMGIFLACAVTAFGGLTFVRRTGEMEESVERASLLASAMPLGFAVFLAATPAYGAHAGLLFGFLFIVIAGLTTIAIVREHELLHAMSGVATVAVFAAWIATSYYPGAWLLAVPFLLAFVALFLLAPFIARRADREFGELGARVVYTAPLLLFVFLVIARVEPAVASPLGLFAMLFAALTMISGYALASGEAGPYLVASFFAVGAEAAWSATHFTPARVGTATALYAVFAVFHLGIPFALRRVARVIEPAWGPSAVVIASLVLMVFFADGARAAAGLWGFALLVGILNAGLFIESAAAGMSALAVLGGLLSWLVVGHWWRNAAPQVGPLPSLLMVVGLALIQLSGYAWTHAAGRRQVSRTPPFEGLGKRYDVLLALASYVFFVATAIDDRLVTPPWPLVGALLVVTLAMTATALAVALPALHAAAVAAAAIVVLFLAKTLPDMPAIIGVAEGVIAYGLVSLIPFGRRASASETAWRGAAVALFVGELTVIVACSAGAANTIALPLVMAVQVANLAAILTIAWLRRWSWIGVAAVAIAALTWVAWQDLHAAPGEWGGVLLLASVMYLVFAAYPFVLGARAGETRDPYFTAIAGSIFFFFAARATLAYSPYASVVGIVPVGEAAVMALLVRQLLRIQPAATRDLGRLALVAATTLAFVTVAIPLQLQHQWITIGWTLEGAALAWLFTRVPHKGLLYGLLALFAAVFVRLALNPAIFYYEPRGMRILNWYLYTYAVAAVSMFAATWWLRTTDDRVIDAAPRASAVLPAAAVILLFVLLNIEVADFYATGPEVTFRFGVTLSQDLTYTIAWLVFGLLMLIAGIYLRNRPARVSAVALIAVTTFKAFLYDLGSLGGLYRVGSLVGLAVSLSLVALALQKFVLAPKEQS